MASKKYLTVTALSRYIKCKFDRDPYLQRVYLTGEISNYRYRPNAHQYFSLKDDQSKISAVMFRSQFAKVKFQPEEGMKVLVSGRISVYKHQGSYQIYVDHMEPRGVGELYQAYEQLKNKLAAAGWFAKAHKQPLVKFPKRIAVITSRDGAVIRDIIVTTRRRYPIVQIVLFPALVQGTAAASDLVRQIHRVNQAKCFDTLIIGRGGGSIEDLWPFNEESVARAIYDSAVPVISSVGHETDTTIADLAADVRAATPTAAAELATPVLTDTLDEITNDRQRLFNAFRDRIRLLQRSLDHVTHSYIFRQPQRLYETYVQQVDDLTDRLSNNVSTRLAAAQRQVTNADNQLRAASPQSMVSQDQQRTLILKQRLVHLMQKIFTKKKNAVQTTVGALDQLSPLKVMSRGYSYVTSHQKVIKSVRDVKVRQPLCLNFYDGQANATVTKIKSKKRSK